MSLKFAEYINPFINIDSVRVSHGVEIKLRILGCVKVTKVEVQNYNYIITAKKYEVETGHHLVTLVITEVTDYIDELVITSGCDNHWKHEP